ncbi:hypothetical protein N7519_006698 [Penicillium mononematosum]|uniref:uncharacterized protein n=1 Tax=Penicillium mononematosum TaxID=268346 RepID=UPI002547D45A|nr:uncharacterized protein N7519_006698 [Penicillium mononematosum]KAJ6185397.1 hypothetical protein N7519_006698 [Penicillium mononematosum]
MISCHSSPVYRDLNLLPRDLSTDPTGGSNVEPTGEGNSEPAIDPITDTAVNANAKPAVEANVEPTVDNGNPTADPITEPVVKANGNTATKVYAELSVKGNVDPAVEGNGKPAVEPTIKPVVEANADPSVKDNVDTAAEANAQATPAGLEPGEIPSAAPKAHRPTLPAKHPRRKSRRYPDRHIVPTNPSPRPGLGQPGSALSIPSPEQQAKTLSHQVAVGADGKASRKRKRALSPDPPTGSSRPAKRNNTSKASKRFCWQLGHEFSGFISDVKGPIALNFAKNILEHPVPDTVEKRLVYFSDASQRALCGAVGIVWPVCLTTSDWEGKGVYYPTSTDDSSILELFGIACSLEIAIHDMGKERATVAKTLPHTTSKPHAMSKEVFVFTDDVEALKRIRGDLAYDPTNDVANLLERISQHSKALHRLGVHVELHLSPGHSGVPGNEAADTLAKKTMYELFAATNSSWSTAKSATSMPTQPAPVRVSTSRRSRLGLPPLPVPPPIIS